MEKEVFVDGVGQIHFTGGMIRLDFITIQPNGENGEDVKPEVKERVIMTPQGFLSVYGTMNQLIEKLVENGVLGRKDEAIVESVPETKPTTKRKSTKK